jgi:hypothetical protein
MVLKNANLLDRKWLDGASISIKLLSSTRGSDMISSNSFCGIIFIRANLDLLSLYNSLDKHEENNLIYYSEIGAFYTQF